MGSMRHVARPRVIFLSTQGEMSVCEMFREHLPEPPGDMSLLIAFDFRELANTTKIIFEHPTLLLNVTRGAISIGPLHESRKSVCFLCLHHWLATGSFERLGNPLPPGEREARLSAQLLKTLATEYADTGELINLRAAIHAIDLSTGKSTVHPIYPLRDCRVCSKIEFPRELGLRIHCSSLTGIIQKMELTNEPVAGTYRAVSTWVAPLSVAGKRPPLDRQDSHGRGTTREQAELGCIGEALERYSLIYRGDEPLQRARLGDINGVDPREILLYSELQYTQRDQWNREEEERYFVGERFDPTRAIEWFPSIDLLNHEQTFVPAACMLMWYPFQNGEPEFARADTIGCGSGWTFEDALAHALLEWIERDAMAIWWYNRISRPSVCLDSFDLPELHHIREGLRRIDRDLVLLDCTTDIGIPAYISISARSNGAEPLFAGASHPSPRVAAWKAASEVGQLWFGMVHSQRIDFEMSRWLANTTSSQLYLKPTHEIEASSEPQPMNSSEQVAFIVGQLKKVGLRSYAADLSRSDVILKTVRAIVPGLRHIWNRRAPGRLYDVPVRMGWRKSPLTEGELNSICCMI